MSFECPGVVYVAENREFKELYERTANALRRQNEGFEL